MEKRIHLSRIWELLQKKDQDGKPVPFDIDYVKLSTGEVKRYTGCILTSLHSKGDTLNVMLPGDARPHKLKKCLIISFNKHKVYL